MNFRNNKGVTLMALTITIIVMLIITSTIIYNSKNQAKMEKINKFYNDIETLNSKIEDYYLKYGDIPILVPESGEAYCNKVELIKILEDKAFYSDLTLNTKDGQIVNPNDGDEYYIIDLEKLGGFTLNFGYGDQYTKVKENPELINKNNIKEIYIINKDTNQIYYPSGIVTNGSIYYVYNIDVNQPVKYISIEEHDKNSFTVNNMLTLNTFKIYGESEQEGNITPDTPAEFQSIGDKTINLLNNNDAEEVSSTIGSLTGAVVTDECIDIVRRTQYDYVKIPITLEAGKTYSLYYEFQIYDRDESMIVEGESNTTTLGMGFGAESIKVKSYNDNISDKLLYTYTPTEDVSTFIRTYSNYGSKVPAKVKFKVMVVEGNYTLDTIPSFEPYGKYKIPISVSGKNIDPVTTNIFIDEPLRKVGDYADYIDLKNKKLVRKIANIIYDGSSDELWTTYGGNSASYERIYNGYRIANEQAKNIVAKQCMCNRLNSLSGYGKIWYGTELGCYMGDVNQGYPVFAITSTQPTVAELKTELSANPLDVIYILNQPQEIQIEFENIQFHNDTNIVTINTQNAPSNIEFSYYEINK